MLRLIIVLPIYFGLNAVLVRSEFFAGFAQDFIAHGKANMRWHLIGYGVALALATADACHVYFRKMTQPSPFWAAYRVYWMALIGVIIASSSQLFAFFTRGTMTVDVLFIPLLFAIAEAVYVGVEIIRARVRKEEF